MSRVVTGLVLIAVTTAMGTADAAIIEQLQGNGWQWFGISSSYGNHGAGQSFVLDGPAKISFVEIQLRNSGLSPAGTASDVIHVDIRRLSDFAIVDSSNASGFDASVIQNVRFDFTSQPILGPGQYMFGAYNTSATVYSSRWQFNSNPYTAGEGWVLRNGNWSTGGIAGGSDMYFRIGFEAAAVPEPSTITLWSLMGLIGLVWCTRRAPAQ